MIKLIKQFVDYLDRRFPPKVHVTEALFDELRRTEHLHRKNLTSLKMEFDTMQAEFSALRKTVDGLKDALTKGGITGIKSEAEKLRESFVAGNFGRQGS